MALVTAILARVVVDDIDRALPVYEYIEPR
jgi:hypothetical protein